MESKNNVHIASLEIIKKKIRTRGDFNYASVEKQIEYVEELATFELGRALIEKKSVDVIWTDYLMQSSGHSGTSFIEKYILTRSPFILAWREVLQIFQKLIQKHLKDGMILASIPCGAMRELLDLDYSNIKISQLIGVDIDPKSLSLARMFALKTKLHSHLNLLQDDAWHLRFDREIDLISSCGLNIYISDRKKVSELYTQFYKYLKMHGKLVISFLTYPPGEDKKSEWLIDGIDKKEIALEKIIYRDILELECCNFRTSEEFERELREVGFSKIDFYYDKLHIFPTVVATK